MTHEHPSPVVAAIIRANLIRLLGPHRGPCALCGHPDARHRTLDAIRERLRAGDTAEDIADDYELDTRTIHRIGDAP